MRPEFVAGVIVAEGCFTSSGDPPRHRFTVALGSKDAETCEALAGCFGVGRVYRYPRREPHHDDVVIFTVQDRRSLVDVVVPFMDAYLPPSLRRSQFERWRTSLLERRSPKAHSPAAAGNSVTSDSQSMREASDHRRSRS